MGALDGLVPAYYFRTTVGDPDDLGPTSPPRSAWCPPKITVSTTQAENAQSGVIVADRFKNHWRKSDGYWEWMPPLKPHRELHGFRPDGPQMRSRVLTSPMYQPLQIVAGHHRILATYQNGADQP